jgi:hypothetical protein
MVKFWVVNFTLEKEPLSKDEVELAENAYMEFAASLDRGQEEEPKVPQETPAESGADIAEQIPF